VISSVTCAVNDALAAAVMPERLDDVDPQTRRKIEVEARWRKTTPELHYREALSARRAADALNDATDDVLAKIRALR